MTFRYSLFKNIISTVFHKQPAFMFPTLLYRMLTPHSKVQELIGKAIVKSCLAYVKFADKRALNKGMTVDQYLIYTNIRIPFVGHYYDSITNMAIAFHSPSYAFDRATRKINRLNNKIIASKQLEVLYNYLTPAQIHQLHSTHRFYDYKDLVRGAMDPIFARQPEYNLGEGSMLSSYITYCNQILPYTLNSVIPSFSIIKPLEEEKTNAALNFLKIWNRYCKTQPKYDGYALNFKVDAPEEDTIEVTECRINKS